MDNIGDLIDELRQTKKICKLRLNNYAHIKCHHNNVVPNENKYLSESLKKLVSSVLKQTPVHNTDSIVPTPKPRTRNLKCNIDALDIMLSKLHGEKISDQQLPLTNIISQNITNEPAKFCHPNDNYNARPQDLSTLPMNSHFNSKAAVENVLQQLDDLLMSLSHFKLMMHIQNGSHTAPYQPHDGNLQEEVSSIRMNPSTNGVYSESTRQDKSTEAKVCLFCHQPVFGKVVTALDSSWHPEHFSCTSCQVNLAYEDFFEQNGQPYCAECHRSFFAPRCAHCGDTIADKCLTAMGAFWHPDHLCCQSCLSPFEDDATAYEHDGKPYCVSCYTLKYCPRCAVCTHSILTSYISAMDKKYHEECFVCKECSVRLSQKSFYVLEGQLHCERHYCSKKGMFCATCLEPIVGRCINAMGRRYHVQHFSCTYCLRQLNAGIYKERAGKPYCNACFGQLFT